MSNCVCSSGLGLPASAVAQHGVKRDKDDLGLLAGSGETARLTHESPAVTLAFPFCAGAVRFIRSP